MVNLLAKFKKLDSGFKGAVKAPARVAKGTEPKTLDMVKEGIIASIQEQIEALDSGKWRKMVTKNKRTPDGTKPVSKETTIRQWHSVDTDGRLYISIRFGSQFVKLDPKDTEPTYGPFSDGESAVKAYSAVVEEIKSGGLDSQIQKAWDALRKTLAKGKK